MHPVADLKAALGDLIGLGAFVTLLVAAGLYWALTSLFTVFQSRLERRISKGYVRTEVPTATGRKRPQFIPVVSAGGAGGIEIEMPTEQDGEP